MQSECSQQAFPEGESGGGAGLTVSLTAADVLAASLPGGARGGQTLPEDKQGTADVDITGHSEMK